MSGALAFVKRHLTALVAFSAFVLIGFGIMLMLDQLSRVTVEFQQALDGTPFEWLVELGSTRR